MYPVDERAVMSPGVRMASSSFYVGLFALLSEIGGVILRQFLPTFAPILLFLGFALGVIAIVLGLVGLASFNRVSAIAGILLGALAMLAFFFMPNLLGRTG